MNPKEKALALVEKYKIKVNVFFREDSIPRIVNAEIVHKSAKQLALIAVDEFLSFQENLYITEGSLSYQYWQEVKAEIEKL
jgi:hypothetical protein